MQPGNAENFMNTTLLNNCEPAADPLAATELGADELGDPAGTPEALKNPNSFWDRFSPREVPFFKMSVLEKLLRRPYHTISVEGPFKLPQLIADYRSQTFRSEASIDRSANHKIERLMLRLDGDVFGFLEEDAIDLYAPTPEAAQAAAQQFRRYVQPQAAGKPRFYIISLEQHGPSTETVTIERPAPFSTEDLALNYGADFPA